jgi:hypothetical protein
VYVCAWCVRACVRVCVAHPCVRVRTCSCRVRARTCAHVRACARECVPGSALGLTCARRSELQGCDSALPPTHTHTRTHISQGQSTVTWGTGPNLPTEIGEVTVGLVSGGTKLVVVGGYTCVTEVSSSDAKPTIPPPFQASSVTIPCRAVVWTKIPAEPPLA